MTKAQVRTGNIFNVAVAPYAAASGAGMLVGSVFGVATVDIANGGAGAIEVVGVQTLACLSTDVIAQGALVYWDNTNKRCTSTASTNKLIGTCDTAKANAETAVIVRLNGAFIS